MNYLDANQFALVNYGDRFRHGEPIATGFVESAVNQVVAKRFVKKQPMRWSMSGAHFLLQIRTRVLNDELRSCFEQWYPALAANDEVEKLAPSSPKWTSLCFQRPLKRLYIFWLRPFGVLRWRCFRDTLTYVLTTLVPIFPGTITRTTMSIWFERNFHQSPMESTTRRLSDRLRVGDKWRLKNRRQGDQPWHLEMEFAGTSLMLSLRKEHYCATPYSN